MSALILSILATFVACVAAAAQVISLGRQRKYAMTQALFQLQLFLAQPHFRSARAAVRLDNWDGTNPEAAGLVCSSFDFAGLMVRRGLVDQDVFFEYWGPVLCLFQKRLGNFLDETVGGDLRGRDYWRDFCWIIEEAKRRGHDQVHPS